MIYKDNVDKDYFW